MKHKTHEQVIGYLKDSPDEKAKVRGKVTYDYQPTPLFADVLGDKDAQDEQLLWRLSMVASFNDQYIQIDEKILKQLSPVAIARTQVLQHGKFVGPNPDLELVHTDRGFAYKNPQTKTIVKESDN